jgi:epoxyqueuosine reductase QueG
VFIEAEGLPFAGDNEHQWVAEFCDTCDRCVDACPGGAIHREPHHLENGDRVFIEREKCAPYFSKGCSVCISSCPFTSGHYPRLREVWFRRHPAQEDHAP